MKMKLLASTVCILAALMAFDPAHAQIAQDIEAQETALDRLDQIEADRIAASSVKKYARIKGGPVTLAEVMRNPDDIELNYRYAQTQLADRNFRGAGATLERILIIDPDQQGVRLLYANVLTRLDNMAEARAQLDVLETAELKPERRQQVDKLRERIADQGRDTTYWAEIGGGFRYQSNANYAPDDERIEAIVATPFGPFAITANTDEEEDDLSYVAMGSAGFEHALPLQGDHNIFGGVSAIWNEQVEVDETDYSSFSGNLGYKWSGLIDVTVQGLGGHFRLDDEAFLNYYGVDVKLASDLGSRWRGTLRHRATYQDYDDGPRDTDERTGGLYEFEIGARYRFNSSHYFNGSLEFQQKKARKEWREFEAWIAELSHLWLAGNTRYVQNRISYGNEEYDAANPRISLKRRDDEKLSYRFLASSELWGLFGKGKLPDYLSDIRVTASASYRQVDSNIRNFQYDNITGELIFSKRFDF